MKGFMLLFISRKKWNRSKEFLNLNWRTVYNIGYTVVMRNTMMIIENMTDIE
jgi:hypothetical protein